MINTEEFRDLIRGIVREELGGQARFKIGTIASADGKPTITFAGEDQPSEKQYSFLGSYVPNVGDRVLLARMKNTYVVMGRIEQEESNAVYVVEKGSNENGDYIRYSDGTQICQHIIEDMPEDYVSSGNIYRTTPSYYWVYPVPFVSRPNITTSVLSYARWGNAYPFEETTEAIVHQYSGSESTTSYAQQVMATGRWK